MTLRDGIKHPLSAPVRSGLETLESLGLLAESSLRDDIRVLDDYDAIVEACCKAWNDLLATPDQLASITRRNWANVS